MTALRPPMPVKLAYGLGMVGEALWITAVTFVFFYYTAVLGLSGSLVGAALFIGLCADAVVDPFFGSWSDNLRSRYGRRVPLMAAGAPLMAVSIGLLFSPPPGMSDILLFAWLAFWSVAVRTFVSMFHVPYVALGAEMSDDYHERTSVVAYRTIFGILAGVVSNFMAYTVFFAGEGGLQQPDRYPHFGWFIAGLGFVCTLIATACIARYAGALPGAAPSREHLLRRLPGEVLEIFRNRSFRLLFLGATLSYAATGMNSAFNTHVNVFVWKLRPETIQFVAYALLAGLLVAVPTAPILARRLEKKTMVIIGMTVLVVAWMGMSLPRAFGLFTATGVEVLPVLCSLAFVAGIGAGFKAVIYPSMMADAADEHEHMFGRRREGLYFAGLGFAFKGAAGLGVLLAGVALDLIGFPKDVGRQVGLELAPDLQQRLVIVWGPASAIFTVAAIFTFTAYGISKRRHDEIAAALRLRREAPAE